MNRQDPDQNGNNCFQNGAVVEAMHLASDEDGEPGEENWFFSYWLVSLVWRPLPQSSMP
jgi:hypothetical protein